MYDKDFYIEGERGNNAFSYQYRNNKRLWVPSLRKISSFDEIELLEKNRDKVTFEDYDDTGDIHPCFGLKKFYSFQLFNTPCYLVDNHNHVLYFWYLARGQGILGDNTTLYHIDEHADTRDPGEYLLKPDSQDLEKVFNYVNFTLNVGNYIIPAQKEGIIGKVIQIRSEHAILEYLDQKKVYSEKEKKSGGIILNIDLDFFQPELDYIDFQLKKKMILDIVKRADLVTIASSPYFIDQELAIRKLKDIFDSNFF